MTTPLNTARNDLREAYTTAKLFCHRCNSRINHPDKVFGSHYKMIYCSQLCLNKSKELDEYKVMDILKKGKSFQKKLKSNDSHEMTQEQINSIYEAIGKPAPKVLENERSQSDTAI